MAGSNNFLQWDSALNNMLSQGDYLANTTRSNGATAGIYPSNLHNKLMYQTTTFITAFGDMLADLGYTVSDADFSALKAVFGNLLTASGGSLTGALKNAPNVNLASISGVVTLPNTSNHFTVGGTEVLTSITGWTQGVAYITWGAGRTLVQSSSLLLRGGVSHTVEAGDVSIFIMEGGIVTEVVFAPIASAGPSQINGWISNHLYSIGDIIYSGNMSSYKRAECVVGGTSGNSEPTWTAIGTLVTDGGVTWIIDDVRMAVPAGTKLELFGVTSALAGTLVADGSAISRTTYSRLFSKIGTLFGVGDGSSTFTLPDHRDKMSIGKGTTFTTIGATGGEINHQLTVPELAAHTHSFIGGPDYTDTNNSGYAVTTRYPVNTGSTGGNQPHNNMPPYLVPAIILIKY